MTQWIKTVIETSSYPGILFLMFLENVFPPIPSELIVPLAGFISTQGRLSLTGVVVAGTLGSVLGAIVLYAIGRKLGREKLRAWCDAHGRWIGLTRKDLEKSDAWFERHGTWAVFFGRVVPGVRSLISLPAGSSSMSFGPFLFFTTIGSAIWTLALAIAGRALGQNYSAVESVIGPISTGIVALIAAMWLWRVFRHGKRAAS